MFGGIGGLLERAQQSAEIQRIFAQGFNGVFWITVTFLSLVCIVLLPRQFHVTVVENNSEKEIRRAAWLFPVYLVLINLFVVPIAAAGLLSLPKGSYDADTFVLALPLSAGHEAITLLAFVGGLSAATAMVIVDSVALAIMVSNGLVLPLLLRHRVYEPKGQQKDMAWLLLAIRRVAIFVIVLLGYLFYRLLGQTHGLASIGLVSFAAIAQFAPAFFGGLVWRNATARGAIAGIVTGFAVWAYTLLLPWIIEAGWVPRSVITDGPLGLSFLSPKALFYLETDALSHGVLWSIAVNVLVFVVVSLLEGSRAGRAPAGAGVRAGRPAAAADVAVVPTVAHLRHGQRPAAHRFPLSGRRARRAIVRRVRRRAAMPPSRPMPKRISICCASPSICWRAPSVRPRHASSCRCCCAVAMPAARPPCACWTMRPRPCNTTAISCSRRSIRCGTGLACSTRTCASSAGTANSASCWICRSELGRVGAPLDKILRTCAERGDFGEGDVDKLVADRLVKLSVDA